MSRHYGDILHVYEPPPARGYAAQVPTRERAGTLTRDLVRVAVAAVSDEKRVRRPTGRALFDHLACLEAARRAFPGLDAAAAACALDRGRL